MCIYSRASVAATAVGGKPYDCLQSAGGDCLQSADGDGLQSADGVIACNQPAVPTCNQLTACNQLAVMVTDSELMFRCRRCRRFSSAMLAEPSVPARGAWDPRDPRGGDPRGGDPLDPRDPSGV